MKNHRILVDISHINYDFVQLFNIYITKLCEILMKIQINLYMNNIFRVNNIITYQNIADTFKT